MFHIDKKKIFNNLKCTTNFKVPRYFSIPDIPEKRSKTGNIIFNISDRTFYGYNGKEWVPFGGAGGGENLSQTLSIGNMTDGQDIVLNAGNIITPSGQNASLNTGFIKVTGFNGTPNGNPITVGGDLSWDESDNTLYLHTGNGTWIPIIDVTYTYKRIDIYTNYTVLQTDDIIAVQNSTTSPLTVTLPKISNLTTPNKYKKYRIVDEGGNAGEYQIIVQCSDSDTINGEDSIAINQNYNSITIYSDGSDKWFLI